MNPLVSIVTPSYNQAAFLEATLQSVLRQNYPHVEYIVIDGGSTDGSVDIIKRYADKLSYWVSEKDRGQTDALNKGFARANGEILAWLNSDDTYEPNAIREAVDFMRAHPEAGLIYGDANFIDKEGQIIGHFPAAQTNYRRLRQGYVHIPQQSSFFRAELWRLVGPLDPTFFFAMDYDLWTRLAHHSAIIYTPRIWANFRLHGYSKTMVANDRCWPEMIRVHRRDGGSYFSIIYAKYLIRRAIASLWHLRLKRKLQEPVIE